MRTQLTTRSPRRYDRAIRRLLSAAATAVVIIFWAIPVAFVGAVSNVPNLCRTYSWLSWLCDLPTPVPGIIAGILPPALLALLFMALPVIFRRAFITTVITPRSC